MTEPAEQPDLAAARAYEDFLVPALFGEWGPRLAAAAELAPGQSVLDVACGTGVLARAAARAVAPTGRVTGLDPDQGMLAVARELAPALEWHQGTAEELPFPDQRFDAVVSQFGLMFFPDPAQGLREMWRVLKPGGHLAVAVWASLDDTPAYAAEVALLERVGGDAAANALRAPFVLGQLPVLQDIAAQAALPPTAVGTIVGMGRFPTIRAMVETDLRGWLPLMGITLTEAQIARILVEAEVVLRPFLGSDGTVRFDAPAHILTAQRAAW